MVTNDVIIGSGNFLTYTELKGIVQLIETLNTMPPSEFLVCFGVSIIDSNGELAGSIEYEHGVSGYVLRTVNTDE